MSTSAHITRDRDAAIDTSRPWKIEELEEDWCNVLDGYGFCVAEAIPSAEIARLISAAPEMREALTDLLEIFEGQDFPALDKARAALRKAEGRDEPG